MTTTTTTGTRTAQAPRHCDDLPRETAKSANAFASTRPRRAGSADLRPTRSMQRRLIAHLVG